MTTFIGIVILIALIIWAKVTKYDKRQIWIRRDHTAAWFYREDKREPWLRLDNHEEATLEGDYLGVSELWPFKDGKPVYDKELMQQVLNRYDEELVSSSGGQAKVISHIND